MAIQAFPFDGDTTTETQFSKMFRELKDNGVVGDISDTSFQVSVDSSGTRKLRITKGSAFVRGFFAMSADATDESVTLDAVISPATSRIDTVVMRLDPSSNSIYPLVLQGTSTAGPTLTQTDTGVWDLPLADVTVLPSNSMSIVDRRRYAGMDTGVWPTNLRPSAPRRGKMGYNITTNQVEVWNGSAWENIRPADSGWVTCTLASGFNTGSFAKVRKIGSVNYLWLNLQKTGAWPTASTLFFTVPTGYRPLDLTRTTNGSFPSSTPNGITLDIHEDGTATGGRIGTTSGNFYSYGSICWLGD